MTPSQSKTPSPTKPPPLLTPSAAVAAAAIPTGRPACAACKHQRRRCSAQCALAPYFPADKQNDFHNVHRLYGIRNVVNLLKQVPPDDRDDAVKSVIHEANFRAMNPVGGCLAVIVDLYRRIEIAKAELQIVAKHNDFHRAKLQQSLDSFEINEMNEMKIRESDFRVWEMEDKSGIVAQILNDNDKPSLTEEE